MSGSRHRQCSFLSKREQCPGARMRARVDRRIELHPMDERPCLQPCALEAQPRPVVQNGLWFLAAFDRVGKKFSGWTNPRRDGMPKGVSTVMTKPRGRGHSAARPLRGQHDLPVRAMIGQRCECGLTKRAGFREKCERGRHIGVENALAEKAPTSGSIRSVAVSPPFADRS
jgi:hypothetical protein